MDTVVVGLLELIRFPWEGIEAGFGRRWEW